MLSDSPAANTWEALFDGRDAGVDAAPAALQAWLSTQGSLTQRLTAACEVGFGVRLLHQTLAFASERAAAELRVEAGEPLLHREVLLRDGDKPLVFACSLLPEAALHGPYEALRQLDERPLGQWIFAEPALQRAQLRHFAVDAADPLFARLPEELRRESPIWGRATRFHGAAKPLLVSEFFLDQAWAARTPPGRE